MTEPALAAVPHGCSRCGRRFMVIAGRGVAAPPHCVCGMVLAIIALQAGLYEVRRSRRASRRRASPLAPAVRGPEPDLGYGESHGYGPAHGGPSGPGDAPAPEPSEDPAPEPSGDPGAPEPTGDEP